MKTPKEWLAKIKQDSDAEVRHGSSVFLTEQDIREILRDGRHHGLTEAMEVCNSNWYAALAFQRIEHLRDGDLINDT